MQLTGRESITRGFVGAPHPAHPRPASFDLTVGRIVVRGEEQHDPVLIQPQETFVIESAQTVSVPKGHVGYAMPKTSLCNEGVLVLNTGLVDPGYDGTLSTIAINFSNSAQRIRLGSAFLRVVFHQLEGAGTDEADVVNAPTLDQLKARSRIFGGSFLDVPGQADKMTRAVTTELLDRQRNAILLLISTVGFLFVMWNLGSYFLMTRQANVLADRVTMAGTRELGVLEERVRQLDARVLARDSATDPGAVSQAIAPHVKALDQRMGRMEAQVARLQALVKPTPGR